MFLLETLLLYCQTQSYTLGGIHSVTVDQVLQDQIQISLASFFSLYTFDSGGNYYTMCYIFMSIILENKMGYIEKLNLSHIGLTSSSIFI